MLLPTNSSIFCGDMLLDRVDSYFEGDHDTAILLVLCSGSGNNGKVILIHI